MDKFELQKLVALPIDVVAERLGLRVVRHKCLCPFHEDHTPSMSFSAKRNTFRCWSCGVSGDCITLVRLRLGLGFIEACRWLADEHNVIMESFVAQDHHEQDVPSFDASRYERFFERPFLNDAARKFLFEERCLDPRVVRWCRLTSWTDRNGVPWLQTPYFDAKGKLVGIQNRNLRPSEGQPRFRFPRGSRVGIYGLQIVPRLKPGDDLWICEGCSDAWSAMSAQKKAIAIPSATLLSQKDKTMLQSMVQSLSLTPHMAPDQDAPGESLFFELREVLPSLVHHQLPEGCKDFSDYYLTQKKTLI